MEKIGTLKVDTILTFSFFNSELDRQEFINIEIPIYKDYINAREYLDREYFPALKAYLKLLGRKQGDLIKISTAADWTMWEKLTGLSSDFLDDNNGKWFFCKQFGGQTEWSKQLIKKYKFGRNSIN